MGSLDKEKFREALFCGHSLDRWTFFTGFIPELEPNFNSPQSPKWHPEGPVHVHICLVVDKLAEKKDIDLSLAALFHDIGKAYVLVYDSTTNGETVKISHAGHEFESHKIVQGYQALIEALGGNFENVCLLVKYHMRTHQYNSGQLKKPGKRKTFEELPVFKELLILAEADDFSKNVRPSDITIES